mmetsp:Transcript_10366/g.32926  ORF Transcript_10366/g.32926 Transcript_10366/m.32926 type:complete len:302 (+) Transcript_10366:2851-3756(+)
MAAALQATQVLRELSLSRNSVGDSGASAMARALVVNTSLQTLRISMNDIADAGASAMAEAMKTNSSLQTLDGIDLDSEDVLRSLSLPVHLAGQGVAVVLEHMDSSQLPLIRASSAGDLASVRRILDAGIAIDAATRYGTTALWAASQQGHCRVVIELLARGANPYLLAIRDSKCSLREFASSLRPHQNLTPMGAALAAGRGDVATLLGTVAVWQSDDTPMDVAAELMARPGELVAVRHDLVTIRRLRDLLRPLVDPGAKECRRARFSESPLGRLPWHLRVVVLQYIVVAPIQPKWGREEFR